MIAPQRRGIERIALEVQFANTQEGMIMVQDEDKSPLHYQLFLNGPENTTYQGHQFQLDILFSKDHPFRPPKIIIQNNIYHLNIIDGQLPFALLKDQWHPRTRIIDIMDLLKNLLINPDEQLHKDDKQFDIFINDREQYIQYAREYTEKYATRVYK
ncbi:hypothetical protein pb186bvf_019176 [Paramecium bursaria]